MSFGDNRSDAQALSYLVQAEFPLVLPVEELSKDLSSTVII